MRNQLWRPVQLRRWGLVFGIVLVIACGNPGRVALGRKTPVTCTVSAGHLHGFPPVHLRHGRCRAFGRWLVRLEHQVG